VWWPDEPWWEKKTIPFGFLTLSTRQLLTLSVFILLGIPVSALLPLPLENALEGRFATFLVLLLSGYAISSRRVKLVPIELQLLYFFTHRKGPNLSRNTQSRSEVQDEKKDVTVTDFETATPLNFTGRIIVKRESRIFLEVDGMERVNDVVSPSKPNYRLIFAPRSTDVGTHEISVRLEGSSQPLRKTRVTVSVKGIGLLEAK